MDKIGFQPISDEELARVRRETRARDAVEPRILKAHYDEAAKRLMLEMRGGATVSTAVRMIPSLAKATAAELAGVKVVSRGAALHWDELDVQMTTLALLQIIFRFRTVADGARRAGQTSSLRKTAAARENGRKGGRPKIKA